MKFVYIKDYDKMKEILIEFIDLFPHLLDKITSIDDYILKIKKNGNMITMQDYDDNVGICCFYNNDFENRFGFISLIGIKKNFQKKGLGVLFLNKLKEIMKNSNMNFIRLEVDDDNNIAIRFYEKNGFVFKKELINSFILEYQIV